MHSKAIGTVFLEPVSGQEATLLHAVTEKMQASTWHAFGPCPILMEPLIRMGARRWTVQGILISEFQDQRLRQLVAYTALPVA